MATPARTPPQRTVPSFATPNTLALRPIQQAIDNIREGLFAIQARVDYVTKLAGQTTLLQGQGSQMTADMRTQVARLRADLDALVNQVAANDAVALRTAPAVVFMDDGEDGDDGVPLPGPRGADGAPGAAGGGTGGATIFMDDGDDGDDGVPLPGPRGNDGAPGASGLNGATIFMADGEDGDDGVPMPGMDRAYTDAAIAALALVGLADVDATTGPLVDGYSLVWDDTAGMFMLADVSGGGGGGGGTVDSVVGTADQITVDSTDPANPVLALAAAANASLALADSAVQKAGDTMTGQLAYETDTLVGAGVIVSLANDTNPGNIGLVGKRSRGTHAAPTAVQSGDRLASLGAMGHTGVGFSGARNRIYITAAQNWSGGATGARLEWALVPLGGTDEAIVGGIGPSGELLVGAGLSAGASGEVLTSQGSGAAPQWSGLAVSSGVYTPTVTGAGNVASSAALPCQWLRVGNTVTVSGNFQVTATAGGATLTTLLVSLPIASALALPEQCAGVGNLISGGTMLPLNVLANTATGEALCRYYANITTITRATFTFTYRVI